MIKISVYSVSDNPAKLALELRSLGCTMVVLTGQRHQRGRCTERFNLEAYVTEECYPQVLDLLLSISAHLVVKDVQEDYSEDESRYFVVLDKLRKHYGRCK